MFHTYVVARSGNFVDFDRASFLMDRDILDASLRAMREARAKWPDFVDEKCVSCMGSKQTFYAAQWVWNHYCARHAQTYGDGFVPDISPNWDQGGRPLQPEYSQARK